MKSLIITLFVSLLFIGNDISSPNFTIVQNGKKFKLKKECTTIKLKKEAFSITFNSKAYNPDKRAFHATQIAVSTTKEAFGMLKNGMLKNDVPCFSPGTGIATNGIYSLFHLVQNYPNFKGHQYIVYNKNGSQRATLISEENEILRLSCDVNTIKMGKIIYPIEQLKEPLFFLLYNDFNKNDVLDKGEFKLVKVKFKD